MTNAQTQVATAQAGQAKYRDEEEFTTHIGADRRVHRGSELYLSFRCMKLKFPFYRSIPFHNVTSALLLLDRNLLLLSVSLNEYIYIRQLRRRRSNRRRHPRRRARWLPAHEEEAEGAGD